MIASGRAFVTPLRNSLMTWFQSKVGMKLTLHIFALRSLVSLILLIPLHLALRSMIIPWLKRAIPNRVKCIQAENAIAVGHINALRTFVWLGIEKSSKESPTNSKRFPKGGQTWDRSSTKGSWCWALPTWEQTSLLCPTNQRHLNRKRVSSTMMTC